MTIQILNNFITIKNIYYAKQLITMSKNKLGMSRSIIFKIRRILSII